MPQRNRKTNNSNRRAPSNWGTTEQLPSGRWRARYRKAGRSISAPQTFDTKEQASAWLAGEHADRSRGVWIDPTDGKTTLGGYARTWLASHTGLAATTRENYEAWLDRWVLGELPQPGSSRPLSLADVALSDLSPALVRAWYAALTGATREAALKRRTPSAARAAARDPHPARRWAASKGIEVAPTGRLSPKLLQAWQRAGSPIVPVERPTAEPADAEAGKTTAARAYSLLRNICNTAVADELMRENPCKIRGAGSHQARERTIASPAEVAALAAAMPEHLATAVVMAAWSGLRFGELFGLARKHVNVEAGTVRVERTLQELKTGQTFGEPKTRKSRRTVHLPRFVVEALREHLAEHVPETPDALVFSSGGAPVHSKTLSATFKRARKVVGRLDLTWHDLRHTGATLAYRAGASVPEVQARLGHTTMRAALIYAHAVDDSDRVLAERLDALHAAESSAPRLRAVG